MRFRVFEYGRILLNLVQLFKSINRNVTCISAHFHLYTYELGQILFYKRTLI